MDQTNNSNGKHRIMKYLLVSAALLIIALTSGANSLQAQVIRGSVEDSSGMPLNDVIVSLLISNTDSVLRSTRTGNSGDFSINVARAGRYRIRLNRIGYAQQTSSPVDLRPAEIITLRFTMAVTTVTLAPVTIVERRSVTMAELMSATGFDMRQSKYPMNAIDAEQLAGEGTLDFETLILNYAMRGLVIEDDTLGRSMRMTRFDRTRGRVQCFPEVYLDGFVLAMGGDLEVIGNPGQAILALSKLGSMGAHQFYGIEAYRGTEVPPAGLGGFFGINSLRASTISSPVADTTSISTTIANPAGLGPCGVVAVWTKVGRDKALIAERARADGGATQVIRGRIVDFYTGGIINGATVTLMSELGAKIEEPVRVDSLGNFRIETKQYSKVRLDVKSTAYQSLTTPPVSIDPEELLSVELTLAYDKRPVAPLRLVSREYPRNYPRTAANGFSFRARRAVGGTYFDSVQVERSGATRVVELLAGVTGISVNLATPSVTFSKPAARPVRGALPVMEPCTPMFFSNGELERDAQRVLSVAPAQIRGIEVYPTSAEVPIAFRMGSTGCGVVAIWTR